VISAPLDSHRLQPRSLAHVDSAAFLRHTNPSVITHLRQAAIPHPQDSFVERVGVFNLQTLRILSLENGFLVMLPYTALSGQEYRTLRTGIPHSPDRNTAPSGQEYRTLRTGIPHPPDSYV